MNAALVLRVYPLSDLRDLWDPRRNPALATDGIGVDARELFQGAIAFTLAHEIDHLRSGVDTAGITPQPPELSGRAAKLRWACPDLVDQRYTHFREQERRADRHAVEVLAQIPHSATGGARRLKYEFGTYWLGLHVLANTMAEIALTIDDPFYRAVVAQQANPQLFRAVLGQADSSRPRDELTGLVFSKTHPADVERLLAASQWLRSQPQSVFFGDPSVSEDSDILVWQLVKQRICDEAHDHMR